MKISSKYIFVLLFGLIVAGCSSNSSKKGTKKQDNLQKQHVSLTKADPHSIAKYVEQASFTALDGKKVSVSDFKGKVVLIDFWETWCKPCIASMPTLNKLQKEFPDRLKVLAVTPGFTDTKADAKKFKENHDYIFTYAMDTNGLHKKLRVTGIPYRVFVSAKGKFIKTEIGNHGPKADSLLIAKVVKKYSSPGDKGRRE
jgi:thiol-disulfide isomerase/thioredoxin